jgi:RHS repeat-associated protein
MRTWLRAPGRRRTVLGAGLAVSLVVQVLIAGSLPRADAATEPIAPPGAGPVSRPLPAEGRPNHGLPPGKRAAAVPPGAKAAGPRKQLSAAERAKAPRPAARSTKPGAVRSNDAGPPTGAQNLVLRPGFAIGDTSLALYFDAADPGLSAWSSWQATVYDVATTTAQVSVSMSPAEAKPCAALRQFCRTFGIDLGWTLVPDQQYFATITVTLSDGTQVTSAASGTAKARGTIVPPALPDAQAIGCACGDVLYPATAGQAIRGAGVNTGTGTFNWSQTDLRLASIGIPFAATRTYSSANTGAGSLGIGWTWGLDIRVIPPAGGQTAVTVRAEDGAQAVFTRTADGSYARPPNVRTNLRAVDGGWLLVTPDQLTYTFDNGGRLTSARTSRGLGLSIEYGATRWTVTDAAGHHVAVEVGSDGLVDRIALPDGRSVRYAYTGGLLTSVTDVLGRTWKYGYTDQVFTTMVDPRGITQLTNVYAGGRVAAQTDAEGAVTRFSFDPSIHEATTIDPDGVHSFDGYQGNVLLYSQNGNNDTINRRYDAALNPNLFVDAKANQQETGFDAAGNATSMTAPDPFSFSELIGYDAHNNPISQTDALGNASTSTYTAFDELQSLTDPLGNQEVQRRDNRGLVVATVDPRGKVTTMDYDAAGNLVARTTPLGEKTTFAYDQSGRLVATTEPRGNVAGAKAKDFTTRFEYDDADRLVRTLAPGKKASETVFDEVGQVVRTADPLGRATTYRYAKVIGRQVAVTDPNGNTTTITYTAAGRQSSVTDAAGNKTTDTYDNRGNLSTVVAPRGNVTGANAADFTTTFVYDSNELLIRTRHPYPGGGFVDLDADYDELDRETTSIDPLGKPTVTNYNNNSDVTSVVDPLGQTAGVQYDKDGRPTVNTAPDGGNSVTEYDAAGNVTRLTAPSGGVVTWTYDDDGRVVSMTDPRGNVTGANPADFTTRYRYDASGNLISVTDPLGRVTRFGYDNNGRTGSVTDANGHTTRYEYDDADQLTAVIGPDAGPPKKGTRYDYDGVGNLTRRTDPNGNGTAYGYDKVNRLVSTVDPLRRETKYRYDADGNQTQIVAPGSGDAAKRTITDRFDILDRRTTRLLGTAGPNYAFGYDAKNRITSLVDPAGMRTQSYDDVDRLTSVSRGGQTFGYGYDGDSNVTRRTWPDGTTVTSTYNTADQLLDLTVSGGVAGTTPAKYAFSYDPSGRPLRTTYPASTGLVTDRGYDRVGRLVDLATRSGGGTGGTGGTEVARFQIARDPIGNPLRVTTSRGTKSQTVAYRYDEADRLLAACYGVSTCDGKPTGSVTYTYDRVGNRTSQTLTGNAVGATALNNNNNGVTVRYSYDDADELVRLSTKDNHGSRDQTLSYDPRGNLTRFGSTRFAYNLDNTKASATSGGTTTRYGYDAEGLQVSATGGTGTRAWSWDVNAAVPQLALDSTGPGAVRGFLGGPQQTALALLTGAVDPLLPDPQASVAAVAAPDGTVQAEYDYDPFGAARTNGTAGDAAKVDNPLRFQGGYLDSTLDGEYLFPLRDYDPTTGRFDSVDPVSGSSRKPAVSSYAYVDDRPTTLRDPSGASSNPLHDAAEAAALPQLYARYGAFNVYAGDVAPTLRGVPGVICVPTYRRLAGEPRRSCPDIIVRSGSRTLVYEVKPASRYGRSNRTARQVARYVRSLRPPRFPGTQAGPPIAPAAGPAPGGGLVLIFSGANWATFAPPGLPRANNSSGVIYYIKARPPQRQPARRSAPAPARQPATVPAPALPMVPGEPDVGLIPNLEDFIPQPDVGLIPDLGSQLHPQPAPPPAQQPAQPGSGYCPYLAAIGCGGVPGGGYAPFPPGIWEPFPMPGGNPVPGFPMPEPAIP